MNEDSALTRMEEVLEFWFEDLSPDDWFGGGDAIDDRIRERFGRFPHRNVALGRVSTPEEIEFLKQPGSSF